MCATPCGRIDDDSPCCRAPGRLVCPIWAPRKPQSPRRPFSWLYRSQRLRYRNEPDAWERIHRAQHLRRKPQPPASGAHANLLESGIHEDLDWEQFALALSRPPPAARRSAAVTTPPANHEDAAARIHFEDRGWKHCETQPAPLPAFPSRGRRCRAASAQKLTAVEPWPARLRIQRSSEPAGPHCQIARKLRRSVRLFAAAALSKTQLWIS